METKIAKVIYFYNANEHEYTINVPANLDLEFVELILMGLLYESDWCPGEKIKMFLDDVEIIRDAHCMNPDCCP